VQYWRERQSHSAAWVRRANGLPVEFAEVLRAVFHGPVQRVFGMGMSGERLTG